MVLYWLTSAVYVFFLLWIRRFWIQLSKPASGAMAPVLSFTIVIPIRNESQNLDALIQDIHRQNYPPDLLEVIVVDDNSEDDSAQLARQSLEKTTFRYRVLNLKEFGLSGKKQAITLAVEHASNEIILTTDGDCRLGRDWVAAFAGLYQQSEDVMVTGPVKLIADSWFTWLQSLEFSGLIGVGAASLEGGRPGMCNGANLSYRKSVFLKVNGYQGNFSIASGDDEFLLQKVHNAYKGRVHFIKDQRAVVTTRGKESLLDLVNQRVRWSSKWKFHKSYFVKFTAIFTFLNSLVFAYMLLSSFFQFHFFLTFVVLFIIRWLTLVFFARPIASFFELRGVFFGAFIVEIFYPFFVIFLGIASIFGHYTWKGRHF